MKNVIFNIFPNEHYLDATLYQHGCEQCLPAHCYGPAVRSHYLFHFIFSGKGIFSTLDKDGTTHTYHLKENEGFLICPGQNTSYIADMQDPWKYAWIEFDGLKVKEWLNNAGLTCDCPIYRNNKKDLLKPMKEELEAIICHKNRSSIYQIGHLYLFMDLLINSSFHHKKMTTGKLKDFYIREAITFIEQNYQDSITVEDIANFCNLNRSYLGKMFKEELKQTPQQFLIFYRMNQATELLRSTEMSISEIGKAVGYPNQLHFSRAFKNVYGVAPSEWRKANK